MLINGKQIKSIPASKVVADNSRQFVSDVEKSEWSGKLNASHANTVASANNLGHIKSSSSISVDASTGVATVVNNSHNHTIANISGLQSALDGKETPTGAQAKVDVALTSARNYADQKVASLINGAPESLNTLKELADALSAHEDEYGALLEVVGGKLNTSHASVIATASVLGHIKASGSIAVAADGTATVVNNSHNHTIANISGLQSALDGKAASNHTHNNYNNQNAYSHVKVGETVISAGSTTDTVTFAAGSNIAIAVDNATKKLTISNTYSHPVNHPASIIAQDKDNRFVTDSEKATWNAKASTAAVTTSANGLMVASDKAKLDGIASGANKYVHPSGDGNLHVPANGTTNNGKFLQAGATAGTLQWASIANASTGGRGLVQLSSATNSTSEVQAATPKAVKAAYDLAKSKANASHGNHVPATESANNARFLRNDNTWQTITAENIGALASGATAVAANKLAVARTITLTGGATGSGTFDGSGNLSIATTVNWGNIVGRPTIPSNNFTGIIAVGSSAFAGEGKTVTITIGKTMPNTNYHVSITPLANPNGSLGEVFVTSRTATTFVVGSTGSTTAAFSWSAISV